MSRKKQLARQLHITPLQNRLKHAISRITNSKITLATWVFFILSCITVASFFTLQELKLQRVRCSMSSGNTCPAPIIAQLESLTNHSLLTLDLAMLRDQIYAVYPQVSRIDIQSRFPQELHVNIHTKANAAALKTGPETTALVVASDNTITELTDQPNPDYPVILYAQAEKFAVGETITDQAALFSLSLASTLKEGFISFSQVKIQDPETITVQLDEGFTAVFSSALDVSRQVNTLQLILSKAKIDQTTPIIDLRFKQPVLKPEL